MCTTMQQSCDCIHLLQENVKTAVEYAEGQIRRLLSGQVELWELPLTGGLWRVTGRVF